MFDGEIETSVKPDGEVEVKILPSYSPLRVYDSDAFAAKNPVFLLYSGSAGQGNDWWPRKLKQDGYLLRSIAFRPISEHDAFHRVFLVSRPKNSG